MFFLPNLKRNLFFYIISFLLAIFIFLSPILKVSKLHAESFPKTDWLMFRRDATHTGFNNDETAIIPLTLAWSFQSDSPIESSTSIVDETLYFKSFNGTLYSLDANTGTLKWQRSTQSGSPSDSSPAIAKDLNGITIYTGGPCTNCTLDAYDHYTGNKKWSISFPKGIRNITIEGEKLYVSSDDRNIRGINRNTGEILWATKLNDGITSAPAVYNGKVYAGTWSGILYALDTNGGAILWQNSLGGVIFSSPSVVNGILFVGSGTQNTYALDANNGSVKWVSSFAKDSVWGSPAVANGIVYISDLVGRIQALDAASGNLVWAFDSGASPSSSHSSPAVANGVVYVGSTDQYIYALDALTGGVLWKYQTKGKVLSSPSIANGMIFIGSMNGQMYVFGTPPTTPTPKPTPSPSPTPIPTQTPTPLPNLGVEDIKQYSSPWNSEIYDNATKWSKNPTIERWGCALTSATMVLRYYKYNIWPNTLNNWLKSQPDGYLRNGLLNWLAISRYTFINQSSVSPILEYRKLLGNSAILTNELKANRPAILRVPNHFVVAKSQLSSTFGINDPAFKERVTLGSYGNSFEALHSFQPSHTDLSYILLVVDPNINLKVFNSSNQEVTGYFSSEDPLRDDLISSVSGTNLNVFLYPTPQNGNYKIEVNGPSSVYTLDSYFYDKDGNSTQSSQQSLILENQKDTFQVSYGGKENAVKEEMTIDSILKDLESAYKLGKIKNKHFYIYLKLELLTVKQLLKKYKDFYKIYTKRILNNISIQIRFSIPLFTDKTVSPILQKDIKQLIDSL